MPSHAFFAIIEAENWSYPLPMPETIWLLHTFAKPHTRTHPVALQNHFVPPGFVLPPLDPPDDADDDVDDPAKGFVGGSGVGSLSSSGAGVVVVAVAVGAPPEVEEVDEEEEDDAAAGSGSAATAATRTNMPTMAITPSAPRPPTMRSTIVRVDIPGGRRGGGGW